MKSALIVSTYNRPKALALCLESIRRQRVLPDEVVIADDGSAQETARLIADAAASFPVPLKHVWQEDEGFRAGQIRNKAVAATDADYIIQVDGDVVLHPAFVADHLSVAAFGTYIVGSRVRLNKDFTEKVERSQRFPRITPWSAGILKDREKSIRLGRLGTWLTSKVRRNSRTAIGCNMAYWRRDFIDVNGYDENFVGWGCEDDDLSHRFNAYGLQSLKLFRIGLVYHLWHNELDKSHYEKSFSYMESKTVSDYFCKNGINKYING